MHCWKMKKDGTHCNGRQYTSKSKSFKYENDVELKRGAGRQAVLVGPGGGGSLV